jgi:cell wall-associated NlpC family hydrolase
MSATAAAISSRRRSGGKLLIASAALLLLLVAVLGGVATEQMSSGHSQPSPVAIADVPTNYLVEYERAGLRFGVDWAVLAAIGKVECDHGRSQAAGCNPPGTMNAAGATGPMQFIGSTWRVGTPSMTVPTPGPPAVRGQGYATDGDGDGIADVWNPTDAIASAARLLRTNGAPDDYRAALLAYNHSALYVAKVLAQAAEYRGAFAPGASGGALRALAWAVAHVGQFESYSQGPSTDRGGSVTDMQSREPVGGTCDCSMFARWAMAQAGIDVGSTTVQQWPANGLLPDAETAAATPLVVRGVGPDSPPGGYRPADLIFFGHGEGNLGHVALWLGNGLIVQCSSSGNGANIHPLAGYVGSTGWVRWQAVSG